MTGTCPTHGQNIAETWMLLCKVSDSALNPEFVTITCVQILRQQVHDQCARSGLHRPKALLLFLAFQFSFNF